MRRTVFGNESLARFDAIVIGSGAGGGPGAYVRATIGMKVLVLAAGPCHLDYLDDENRQPVPRFSNDELKIEHRNFIEVHESVEPRTWRTSPADGDRTITGNVQNLPKTVGGGCLLADLKMPRFEPTDFQLGTLLAGKFAGTSFADWPVQYDELETFYAWGERLLGVQGQAGANPFEGPRSSDYPIPPGPLMYGSAVVHKSLEALGYTMFPYPTAVNSVPYDGHPACVNCGFCSGYPCAINAKGSTAVTMLRKALLSGNCLLRAETRVVKPVARCTYQNHAVEGDAGTFYEPKLLDVFQAAGARYMAIAPRDAIPSSQHIMGTLRSGASPATSVTDANGKLWDLGNLYASDGAIFPTSSGYNPTMTIVAMALRVAAAIVKPSAPASVIT